MRLLRILTPILLASCLLGPLAGTARAQDPVEPDPPAEEPAKDEPKTTELVRRRLLAADVSSPRALYRTFFRAFSDERKGRRETLRNLVECVGAGWVEEERRLEYAIEVGRVLKDVLDYHGYITLEALPDEYLADDADLYTLETRFGPVECERVDGRDQWVFTRDTLERAESMRAQFEESGAGKYVAFALNEHVPDALRGRLLFLEYWQALGLLVLLAGCFLVHVTVVFVARGVIANVLKRLRWLERAGSAADAMATPLGLFGIWVWLNGATPLLELPYKPFLLEESILLVAKLFGAIGAVLVFYRGADVVSLKLEERSRETESKVDDQLIPLLRRSLKVVVTVAGILFVLESSGIPTTSLLASVGVASLGIALAAKDTIANLFGSLTVLIDKPFHVGDWVLIDKLEGTVEEVGFRSTRIRTFYNSVITLPNAKLVDTAVDNMGRREFRRFKTHVNVRYETPPEKIAAFCAGMRGLVLGNPHMRHDYFEIYLNQFGAHSLDILVYVFFRVPDWDAELRERQIFMLDVIRLASEMGVEFAYPTTAIHLESTPESPVPTPATKPVDELERVVRRFKRGGDMARPEVLEKFSYELPGGDDDEEQS